jgi:alanyl-tRNA synthetase
LNGLVAGEWAAQVANIVGGKAGGKENMSMGSGTDITKGEEGLNAARMYLEKLKI